MPYKDPKAYLAYQREWHRRNPGKKREYHDRAVVKYGLDFFKRKNRADSLRRKYQMTPEQWDGLLSTQDHRCALCGGKPRKFHTDHNHDTGQVRGLLCYWCNQFVAWLGDTTPEKADTMIKKYLSGKDNPKRGTHHK